MQRLAAALACTALSGAVAACGAPDHGAPRHIVAMEASPVGFHRTMAGLEEVRGAVAARPPAAPARASRSRPRPRPTAAPAGAPAPVPAPAPAGDVWTALARCESGMRNDTGAPYYGYFQFSAATWQSLGFSGLPSDHDYATQLAAAQRLVARSGWGQFPACARRLGLR